MKDGKDSYHWVFTSSEWNNIYSDKINTLDLFKSFKGKRIFYDKVKSLMNGSSSDFMSMVWPIY